MIEVVNVWKSYRSGTRWVEALRGHQLPDRTRPVRVHRRPERLGQEHAALPAGGDRPARPRARSWSTGKNLVTMSEADAERLSPRPGRLHLPVVQPDQQPDGPRERAGAVPAPGRDGRAEAARRRAADAGRPGRPPRPPSLPALRRRAAARGHRPGPGEAAAPASWPTSRPASSTPRPATRSTGSSARCSRSFQTTLVVVTHDRRFITPDDLVLEIQDGQLVEPGGTMASIDSSQRPGFG